jgi:hypothetical protein
VGGAPKEVTVTNVNNFIIIVASVICCGCIIFCISKLPSGKNDEKFEGSMKAAMSLIVMTVVLGILITIGS